MTDAKHILAQAYALAETIEARSTLIHAIKWLNGQVYRPSPVTEPSPETV